MVDFCQQLAGLRQRHVETLTRPEKSGQKGGTQRSRTSERSTACRFASSDKDSGVGRGLRGMEGVVGRLE